MWCGHFSVLLFDTSCSNQTMSSEGKSDHPFNNAYVANESPLYEGSDNQILLQQIHYTHQRCFSKRWKLLLWIGIILLILGTLAIVVSYIIPSPEWVTASVNLDNDVQIYNKLEQCNNIIYLCKVIGFLIFCFGGVLLTLSLLFSSCFVCSDKDEDDYLVADEYMDYTDRIGRLNHRAQTTSSPSCTTQDILVSEMLRQKMNTEALSVTLI